MLSNFKKKRFRVSSGTFRLFAGTVSLTRVFQIVVLDHNWNMVFLSFKNKLRCTGDVPYMSKNVVCRHFF